MIRIAVVLLLVGGIAWTAPRRKIIVDEDCSGPGGSNMHTVALLLQSPQAEVLGVTVVSGNSWRDEEVAHALRLLEIMGRTDVPVMSGAAFPLVRSREEAIQWQKQYGKSSFSGPGMTAGGTSHSSCRRFPKASPPATPRMRTRRISWCGWCVNTRMR